MSASEETILVLYYTRGVYPLRDTIRTHLYSFANYSRYRVVYVNTAFPFPEKLLRKLKIDAIIFHTIFLGMRWGGEKFFRRKIQECACLKELDCVKIAMPQDEFIHTDMLNDFIVEFGITHLLTCAYEPDWPTIYNKVDRDKVSLRTVLTGYLDHHTVERVNRKKDKVTRRDIDIGYRAWKAEYWLGEHGTHKVRVGEVFADSAPKYDLHCDISLENKDVLNGDDWFDFLLRCRATVGVEGGASVLDRYGTIRQRVNAFVQENPGASFEETREKCFPQEDHKISLACISPRHLEACLTETCQVLIEGEFNEILQPDRHYIPVKRDYSNVAEVCRKLQDDELVRQIAHNAYVDIVECGKYTYENFVREIETETLEPFFRKVRQQDTGSPCQLWRILRLHLRDQWTWNYIRFELWYGNLAPDSFSRKTLHLGYRVVRRLAKVAEIKR